MSKAIKLLEKELAYYEARYAWYLGKTYPAAIEAINEAVEMVEDFTSALDKLKGKKKNQQQVLF